MTEENGDRRATAAGSREASTPRRLRDVSRWDFDYDVVVVGQGSAGAAAAIEAARGGARTAVLERASRGGGTTALSTGVIYFGGGTRVQNNCGFEDSVENMTRYVRLAAGTQADDEKVQRYCEGSVEHFQWFCDLGMEFKDSYYADKVTHPLTDDCLLFSGNEKTHPFAEHSIPVPRGHKVMREGEAGGYLMEVMLRATQEAGAEVINDCLAETLVVDEAGRVVGVVALIEGQERLIKARKGVILTAGGFIMNRQMLAKHAPALLACNHPLGTPGDDGRGIRMGMGAGGAAVNMSEGLLLNAYYPPSSHLKGIMVSAQGQRFINEDSYLGRTADAIVYKADGAAYLIVDDEIYGQTQSFHKLAAVAESFEDLEGELGMPRSSLTRTIAYYNECAERGEDPLFHKAAEHMRPLSKPPYAALDCSTGNSIFAAFTLGGLDTRVTGEVRNADGGGVPGLYAAGRNSAGLILEGRSYASGLSIGGASFFGRLAGKQVAGAEGWE